MSRIFIKNLVFTRDSCDNTILKKVNIESKNTFKFLGVDNFGMTFNVDSLFKLQTSGAFLIASVILLTFAISLTSCTLTICAPFSMAAAIVAAVPSTL